VVKRGSRVFPGVPPWPMPPIGSPRPLPPPD